MNAKRGVGWVAVWMLVVGAAAAQLTPVSGGVVVVEAELFSSAVNRSGHSWVITNQVPGYYGSGYVQALPNTGANFNATWTTTSPELVFPVGFATSGTHYVWLRGYAENLNEDSAHVGVNGSPAGASNMTWQFTLNAWTWTNATASGVATIVVPAAGSNRVHLWMREDGARIDRLVVAQRPDFRPIAGESFHVPVLADANLGGEAMRHPPGPVFTTTVLHVYSGNQDTGPGGNPGNQLQSGSMVYYKAATDSVWRATGMVFVAQGPSGFGSINKYYRAVLPVSSFRPGDAIQYYLRIAYDTHLTTFLYGNDLVSFKTDVEELARQDPFTVAVRWSDMPGGAFVEITNTIAEGEVRARVQMASGHLAITGPDRAGNPLAQTIQFDPMEVVAGGETLLIGEVLGVNPVSNGVELVQRLAQTSIVSRMVFTGEGVVQYEVLHWGGLPVERTAVSAVSPASERVYGFGEKFNAFDQSGRNIRILTWDPPGDKGDLSYKVAPWFVSTRGYGFHLESSAESYFDMRFAATNRWASSNLFPSLRFRVVYGPTLTNVLERYTAYTGRPQVPPAWAFAPWISSDIWRTGGEVRFLITKLRERNIPGSVIVFDSPWETAYNDFTWNMTQFGLGQTSNVPGEAPQNWPGFASVGDMMTFIRTNGYKVICWMTPFINTNSFVEHTGEYGPGGVPGQNTGRASNYNAAAAAGYFVRASPGGPPLVSPWWKGRGSPVDFTNPDARLWIMAQLSNLVTQSGGVIGGFKTDDGETGTYTDTFIPTSAVYHDGRTGVEMRNGFSVEYHRSIWNVLGTNGILFSRSGFTGTHAFPAYWAGDNEPNFGVANGLPTAIVAGQSAAMSGYSIWSHDIGGYQDGNHSSTPSNLFMRWTQFGAFSPLMQMHRQVGTGRQFPWSYGPQAESNYHFYAHLHTALFPYRYSYAKASRERGLPVIRPLVLLYPDDPNTHGINHTYLFGNELLVAVIITNQAVSRDVYLPAGGWHDFWNNAYHPGGQVITWTNADQRLFPVFVRAGSIVPMLPTNVQTLLGPEYTGHAGIPSMDAALSFRVYPGPAASFEVYDGARMTCATTGTVVSMVLTSPPRPVVIEVLAPEPHGVERDGVPLPKRANPAALASSGFGWAYDGTAQRVLIREDAFSGERRYDLGPDSAGDGITDAWRLFHFGSAETNAMSCASCDADLDGMTNLEEYRTGTDPMSANSLLAITTSSAHVASNAASILVAWPGVAGLTYSLGWSDSLSNHSAWMFVPGSFTGSGSAILWYDDGSQTGTAPGQSPTGQRYYRVRVP